MKIKIRKNRQSIKFKCQTLVTSIFVIILLIIDKSSAFVSYQNFGDLNQIKTSEVDSVSRALVDVVYKFYIANIIQFNFIIYGERTKHIDDVITTITKELSNDLAVSIKHIKNIKNWDHTLNQSAIFLIQSKQNLINFYENCILLLEEESINTRLTNTHPKKLKFVVYTEEIKEYNEIANIVKIESTNVALELPELRFFEFFIINELKSVSLVANLLYSEEKCGEFVPKLLNSFDKKSQKWERKLENFEHFSNFHGCLLTSAHSHDWLFYSDYKTLLSFYKNEMEGPNDTDIIPKDVYFHGLNKELLDLMGERSNFSNNFVFMSGDSELLPTNIFLARRDYTLHIIPETVHQYAHGIPVHHQTLPFFDSQCYYLVTPNDLYSNYEKMTFAFDSTTWILILFSYGLVFGVIAGLNVRQRWIRTVVFGQGVTNPAYNALGAFFGIGQTQLPQQWFSRFVLITYIWFCLIIRTCYQSMMFEFLTSDMRKPLPETLEDLVEYNYTILFKETPWKVFDEINIQIVNGRKIPNVEIVKSYDFQVKYVQALNKISHVKYAFLIPSITHRAYTASFKKSLPIMKSEKLATLMSLQMRPNGILLDQLSFFLDRLIPSGIANHLIEYGLWFLNRPLDPEIEDPRKVLTVKMLEFGFVLWLAACFVSTLVFLCEIQSLWLKRKLRKFIGLFDFLRVLKARLSDYHDKW